MLKTKAAAQILEQANTQGVTASLLLNSEGSLLAFAGNKEHTSLVAAMAANMWTSYKASSLATLKDSLSFFMVECEGMLVAMVPASSFLVCLVAESSTPLGALRLKAETVGQYLAPALSELTVA